MAVKQHILWHALAALAGFVAGAVLAAIAILAFGAPRGVVALYGVAFGATVIICALEWERRKRGAVRS